ncbi:hypothetical protein DAEQUDRAFT_732437 [Daedalea quercina L-15889]|uniref:VWFA domain-containing protein n=1 Tax=Daedalea quercina L-15889 TaxID=1314783 RepID=A0A165LLT7_9APHY|nr:hypothetical protein DAEQUDRAFT_732437 [Daedalea quercina L-15889]
MAYLLPQNGTSPSLSSNLSNGRALPEDDTSHASDQQDASLPKADGSSLLVHSMMNNGSVDPPTASDEDDFTDRDDGYAGLMRRTGQTSSTIRGSLSVPRTTGASGLPTVLSLPTMPVSFAASRVPIAAQTSHKPDIQSALHAADTDTPAAPMPRHTAEVTPRRLPRACTEGNGVVSERVDPSRAGAAPRAQQLSAGPSRATYAHRSTPPHAAPVAPSCPLQRSCTCANLPSTLDISSSYRVMLLRRMSGGDFPVPEQSAVEMAPTPRHVQEVIVDYVASSGLQENFQGNQTFLDTVAERVANLPVNDPHSFPVSEDNTRRITWLSMYQPIIYCDDSSSMLGERWILQRDLVNRIASIVTRVVPDNYGVWLRFINSLASWDNLPYADVLRRVDSVRPAGGTPLGTTLRSRILQPLVYDVLQQTSHRRLERPLLICVITDGCPTDGTAFENAIVECRRFLTDAGCQPTQVLFCVNQIGDATSSVVFLDRLRNNQEIQDVVHCTTGRLDAKFRELRENERKLEEWLLKTLSDPIMPNVTTDVRGQRHV